MPMYDRECSACQHRLLDCYEPITPPEVACPNCGAATTRTWFFSPPAVIQDSIEGGVEIRHGICNEDGTPRRYYSKSEMRAEAARRGLVNAVRHTTPPGSDKAPHTSRWV